MLVVFEYGTLNGGERSMLAVFDALGDPAGRNSTPSGRGGPTAGSTADGVELRPAEDASGGAPVSLELTAAAPRDGPLAAALAERAIRHVPFELRDGRGVRIANDRARERLLAIVSSIGPDIVHANSLAMGRLTGGIADQLAIPTIAHLRDILRLSAAAVADLNRNRCLVAVSEASRAFHLGQGLNAARTQVIYNGVDARSFQPRTPNGSLRRELGVPPGAFLIGTIGQIGLRKGQDMLAEAAALASASVPQARYVLIGERHSAKPESIAFEARVAAQFERAGLAARFHRLGYRDDVPRLLNELDLLVHPAHQEPLGRVLLEAAASGLPIIATAVGGTPEILTDGESGRLVPPGDAARLAEAIVELVNDAGLRAKFAVAARRVAIEKFPVEQSARRLRSLWIDSASNSG